MKINVLNDIVRIKLWGFFFKFIVKYVYSKLLRINNLDLLYVLSDKFIRLFKINSNEIDFVVKV